MAENGVRFFLVYIENNMNYTINPFQQLYFSDDTKSENFVELFSDIPLQGAISPVFQGGNVVLSGTQGCGKTMILSLLRPETRIAYHNAKRKFPVDESMRGFISAGVNLTRSAITEVAQITLGKGESIDGHELPLYFADFFNYWVIQDLLKSIVLIGESPKLFGNIVKLDRLPQFVKCLVGQDCWFDELRGVTTIEGLSDRVAARIAIYRKWVGGNYGGRGAPSGLRETKTNVGEPIARAAECLRESGMIGRDVPVLIRVDQIEEMHRAFTERQRELLLGFRKILNRAFASRDARVHYRAGTRRYGWENPEYLTVWGSEARLEIKRDYLLIDMDEELFARGETTRGVFGRFAEDAFQKRVEFYYRSYSSRVPNHLVRSVFGKKAKPTERLKELKTSPVNNRQIDRALGLDSAGDGGEWTMEWRKFLREIYRSDDSGKLDAVLAAAWGRQTGGGGSKREHRRNSPPTDAPWRSRKWWRKERLDQAVLQLVTRCQQRLMWWGYPDVVSLSGGNITVFLHICHRVWDGFLRSQTSFPEQQRTNLLTGGAIDYRVQAAGIQFASNDWSKKMSEEPGGDIRQRFAEVFGKWLNRQMLDDIRMSYPGGNGISLARNDFLSENETETLLRQFLNEAVGYGVLFASEHASKKREEGRRRRFYLNPVLCPRYQLPEARTKEPYYVTMADLLSLVKKAEVTLEMKRQGGISVGAKLKSR